MYNLKLRDDLEHALGTDLLLDNVFAAMNTHEADAILRYIARCYDIELEQEGE